jgi:hypothetical protein
MQTIKRTRSRRFSLALRAASETGGPYFLVDLAGYGASWRNVAHERVPAGEPSTNPHRGTPFARRATWVPVYRRAALAFELAELEPSLPAREAKELADRAWNRMGPNARAADVERWALHLLATHAPTIERRALKERGETAP